MKTCLCIFLLLIALHLQAQSHKWEAGIEISAALSNVTNPSFFPTPTVGFQPSANSFIKVGHAINDKLTFTVGAGYLTTDQYERLPFGIEEGWDQTEFIYTHRYFVFPAGVKFHFGSFFLNPELSLAVSDGHVFNVNQFDFNENSFTMVGTSSIVEAGGAFSELTFPVFLSFGNVFDFGRLGLLVGCKGYFSLNNLGITTFERHYYGIGLMTGLKWRL